MLETRTNPDSFFKILNESEARIRPDESENESEQEYHGSTYNILASTNCTLKREMRCYQQQAHKLIVNS